ncbi:PLP-dependent aminotransferase family protein [Streptomyces sp. NPDC020412]|uniref:PLP-dependent aminotransferase family protein n=1 Tax=Streptomyces sp. NPDC020412 TaxID=3365073 RepID=UPI00379F96C9
MAMVTSSHAPLLASRASSVDASPVREILALTEQPDVISFAGGLPAPELFDVEGMSAAFAGVLTETPRQALQYSTTEGDPSLREAVAARLGSQGLPTGPDDLLITTGSQQALSLVVAATLDPGDTVLVEDPTYLAALQCLKAAGARVLPVPCDAGGVDPSALADLVARERPKLLYVIPNFQNPTGRTLSAARRAAIAYVVARSRMWVVEDDPYGELRFEGDPVPWLTGFDDAAPHAVLIGSFSKIMAPGLRLGWLRAPRALRRACVIAKQTIDLHTSTLDQAAAARYLRDADLDAHLARVRHSYRERRDTLLRGLPHALPRGSTWTTPDGGMFVWARLPAGFDASALLHDAVAQRVAYVPGAPFFVGAADEGTLRLSFTTHTPPEIETGLRRLRTVFKGAGESGTDRDV